MYAVKPFRIAVIADYAEENWPSMDLVADMLLDHLRKEHGHVFDATLVRPPMRRRLTRFHRNSPNLAFTIDRIAARQWDYPRALAALRTRFDAFHIVDHSYAHLAHELPAERTVVTCHDVDAFRAILQPAQERRSAAYRWMARRILDGVRRVAHVACDSETTRTGLIALAGLPPARLSVIPNGADTGGYPERDSAADLEAARLIGPLRGVELLHVGSTIPRKRIDVLLAVLRAVRLVRPDVHLIRVGGPFTAEQRVHARELGVAHAITVVPFVDRQTLAAIYRRAAIALLPSEREGFGLPLVEALACGTPVVASEIDVLREVGGAAATFCGVGDVGEWRDRILHLLREREQDRDAWHERRELGLERAAEFSWSRYTDRVADIYAELCGAREQRQPHVEVAAS